MFFHDIFPIRCSRHTDKPATDHGEVSPGPVRAVQPRDRPRRARRGDQQEAVARDHQRSSAALVYYIGSFHLADTVSFTYISDVDRKILRDKVSYSFSQTSHVK